MRLLSFVFLFLATFLRPTLAQETRSWEEILGAAQGQTVYWNAWGGKAEINDYMRWAGDEVERLYGVKVEIVKLSSTAEAVQRVLAEKAAGKLAGGSVDLIWINGENFASLKAEKMLYGPWVAALPNWALVQQENPAILSDFGTSVEGLEAPYGLFQLNLVYDSQRVTDVPHSLDALLSFASANPGRFTYPGPEDFIGATFLKQLLLMTAADPTLLQKPVGEVDFATATQPLWDYLDKLHPSLWRQGKAFPTDEAQLRQMLADGEVDFSLSFGPGETSAAIAQGILPQSARTFVFDGGTIGNASFLAIPFNASAKEGAMVLVNFLLSPEAQAKKQDPAVWGALTVLDLTKVSAEERAFFDALPAGPATLTQEDLGAPLAEPHFTWAPALVEAWLKRYRS